MAPRGGRDRAGTEVEDSVMSDGREFESGEAKAATELRGLGGGSDGADDKCNGSVIADWRLDIETGKVDRGLS